MTQRCKGCRFFKGLPDTSDRDGHTVGQCRRHAPSADYGNPFPVVWSDSWCGDHERGMGVAEEKKP